MNYEGEMYNLEKDLENGTYIYVREDGKMALIVNTLMVIIAVIKTWCAENESFIEVS
jgi:hypothetical protein